MSPKLAKLLERVDRLAERLSECINPEPPEVEFLIVEPSPHGPRPVETIPLSALYPRGRR